MKMFPSGFPFGPTSQTVDVVDPNAAKRVRCFANKFLSETYNSRTALIIGSAVPCRTDAAAMSELQIK
jgi:hypothetical protein